MMKCFYWKSMACVLAGMALLSGCGTRQDTVTGPVSEDIADEQAIVTDMPGMGTADEPGEVVYDVSDADDSHSPDIEYWENGNVKRITYYNERGEATMVEDYNEDGSPAAVLCIDTMRPEDYAPNIADLSDVVDMTDADATRKIGHISRHGLLAAWGEPYSAYDTFDDAYDHDCWYVQHNCIDFYVHVYYDLATGQVSEVRSCGGNMHSWVMTDNMKFDDAVMPCVIEASIDGSLMKDFPAWAASRDAEAILGSIQDLTRSGVRSLMGMPYGAYADMSLCYLGDIFLTNDADGRPVLLLVGYDDLMHTVPVSVRTEPFDLNSGEWPDSLSDYVCVMGAYNSVKNSPEWQ